MTRDEQARQRLVEIARREVLAEAPDAACVARQRAGFRNPSKGSWCAAGLTAAMAQAGLLVPAPGTPARRGAIALLDFVATRPGARAERADIVAPVSEMALLSVQPGDIIAWKQNQEPEEWIVETHGDGLKHAFSTATSPRSMCGKASRANGTHGRSYMEPPTRCSSCVWETRKGHVALIAITDDLSLTTIGWNEGAAPGRVMMRRLWHKPHYEVPMVPPQNTVLLRRPGGLYGIARPVAA